MATSSENEIPTLADIIGEAEVGGRTRQTWLGKVSDTLNSLFIFHVYQVTSVHGYDC